MMMSGWVVEAGSERLNSTFDIVRMNLKNNYVHSHIILTEKVGKCKLGVLYTCILSVCVYHVGRVEKTAVNRPLAT